MKRYKPIPSGEVEALAVRLAGKTLEEIVATLGPPARERGPSPHYQLLAGQTDVEAGLYVKTLEYTEVSPSIKTLLVRVCENGELVFEFRGEKLNPPSN